MPYIEDSSKDDLMTLQEIQQQLRANGVTPVVVKLKGVSTHHRPSLFGLKSRVSGRNRKGQTAHGVGTMDANQIMTTNGCMKP